MPLLADASDWPLCFSESEWNTLEADIKVEMERTAREAVEAAVKPYQAKIDRLSADNLWLTIGLVVVGALAIGTSAVAVFK